MAMLMIATFSDVINYLFKAAIGFWLLAVSFNRGFNRSFRSLFFAFANSQGLTAKNCIIEVLPEPVPMRQ